MKSGHRFVQVDIFVRLVLLTHELPLVSHFNSVFFLGSITGLKTPDQLGSTAGQVANQVTSRQEGDLQWNWKTLWLHTHTLLPPSLHYCRHVSTQQQSRKRGLLWGSPSARVPFFPFRHGPRSPVNGQPSAQPWLILPWCSVVSTSGLPSRLRELESWRTGAAGQTGGAEQVRAVLILYWSQNKPVNAVVQ